jgi:hypothetical protein
MKLLLWLFQFFVGCHHNQLSRVFTIKQRTYQVCFQCGKEFEYSWALMHSSLPWNVVGNAAAPLNEARHADVAAM